MVESMTASSVHSCPTDPAMQSCLAMPLICQCGTLFIMAAGEEKLGNRKLFVTQINLSQSNSH